VPNSSLASLALCTRHRPLGQGRSSLAGTTRAGEKAHARAWRICLASPPPVRSLRARAWRARGPYIACRLPTRTVARPGGALVLPLPRLAGKPGAIALAGCGNQRRQRGLADWSTRLARTPKTHAGLPPLDRVASTGRRACRRARLLQPRHRLLRQRVPHKGRDGCAPMGRGKSFLPGSVWHAWCGSLAGTCSGLPNPRSSLPRLLSALGHLTLFRQDSHPPSFFLPLRSANIIPG